MKKLLAASALAATLALGACSSGTVTKTVAPTTVAPVTTVASKPAPTTTTPKAPPSTFPKQTLFCEYMGNTVVAFGEVLQGGSTDNFSASLIPFGVEAHKLGGRWNQDFEQFISDGSLLSSYDASSINAVTADIKKLAADCGR